MSTRLPFVSLAADTAPPACLHIKLTIVFNLPILVDMHAGPLLNSRPDPVDPDVRDRLRDWVRAALDLHPDEVVTITQLACHDRGCAPVETVLTVLRPGAPESRTLPLPAAQVCLRDVLTAFDHPPSPDLRSTS